jgi:hypothetical protein
MGGLPISASETLQVSVMRGYRPVANLLPNVQFSVRIANTCHLVQMSQPDSASLSTSYEGLVSGKPLMHAS